MEDRRPVAERRQDDGIDRWETADAPPAAILAGHVDRYGYYAEHIASFAARRELAATCGVLIYALGDPLSIIGADGREIVLQAGEGFAGGIADATSISRALGPQRGVHIQMPLASLAAVIGAPVAALANRVVPLADLIGKDARDLGHRLGSAAQCHAQFDLLDAFLVRRLADAPPPDRAVAWAIAQLGRPGPPTVQALAREIGWSRKHLAQRFAAVTGFSPQRYRSLARFERFSAAIAARPDESLAMLAIDAGYHDQPHMSREVQAFGAMTPGELRRRLLPGPGGVREA